MATPSLLRVDGPVCRLRLDRDDRAPVLDRALVDDCLRTLDALDAAIHIVVLEGAPDAFCAGADFDALASGGAASAVDPERLYALWSRLANGPFVSIAHVRGAATAGGVGFAASCDLVLAADDATFALPELLFDLYPACVLPFLVRRVGFQRAHYMTLTTRPVTAREATAWGLADATDADSEALLRRHLLRLRRVGRAGISRYKAYAARLHDLVEQAREDAVAANRALFSDEAALATIRRYVRTGALPWEA
ncbi:MAG: enoyl-CoA hydratase/isomerase [Burkholderia sp.]